MQFRRISMNFAHLQWGRTTELLLRARKGNGDGDNEIIQPRTQQLSRAQRYLVSRYSLLVRPSKFLPVRSLAEVVRNSKLTRSKTEKPKLIVFQLYFCYVENFMISFNIIIVVNHEWVSGVKLVLFLFFELYFLFTRNIAITFVLRHVCRWYHKIIWTWTNSAICVQKMPFLWGK